MCSYKPPGRQQQQHKGKGGVTNGSNKNTPRKGQGQQNGDTSSQAKKRDGANGDAGASRPKYQKFDTAKQQPAKQNR